MALRPLVTKQDPPYHSPNLSCYLKPSFQSNKMPQKVLQTNISRRIGTIAAVASILAIKDAIFVQENANGLDLRMVAPEQTIEEAEMGFKDHVQSLLDIKPLLESESWREAQKALRKSSSNLKLDLNTIIQSKPGKERPPLRKIYSNLFNNVTRLDYAARDKDAPKVWLYYDNIVVALDDLLSKI